MVEQDKKRLLLVWMEMLLTHEKLSKRIADAGYSQIAVCGYREYGRLLVRQLSAEGMCPVCIIEKNYQSLQQIEQMEIPIVGFLDMEVIRQAEVIIVTPDIAMEEACEDLEMAGIGIPVCSLEYFVL